MKTIKKTTKKTSKSREPNCPKWQEFLNKALKGDLAKITALQKFFGYCLSDPDTDKYQKALLLCGPGLGKSTAAKILVRIMEEQNVSRLSLSEMADPFKVIGLENKLLNISDGDADFPPRRLVDARTLKEIIAGEFIRAKRKFEKDLTFIPAAKLVFVLNYRPRTTTLKEGGIARRFVTIYFPAGNISPKSVNPNLYEQLRTEQPEILRWALKGLARLNADMQFTAPAPF